ncbi:unnamed protein product [Caenorhabditis auriculariae]|uniref:BTB domain-containing protein n=1 Tax=Caenorhabditis auriculariae TaxID=2777116 RepID=A0A8S1GTE8_9PELO|nr:unnamed protein product [Caenorhabditis auriculariae]
MPAIDVSISFPRETLFVRVCKNCSRKLADRSPVYKDMVDQAGENDVIINDFGSDVIRWLLNFANDNLDVGSIPPADYEKLLNVATDFRLEGLQRLCEDLVSQGLSREDTEDMFEFAETCSDLFLWMQAMLTLTDVSKKVYMEVKLAGLVSDRIDLTVDQYITLLKAAGEARIEVVKMTIEQNLLSYLSHERSAEVAIMALKYEMPRLREHALELYVEQCKSTYDQDPFREFRKFPVILLELRQFLRFPLSESHIFENICDGISEEEFEIDVEM